MKIKTQPQALPFGSIFPGIVSLLPSFLILGSSQKYIITISIYCYYSTIYEAVFVISFYNT